MLMVAWTAALLLGVSVGVPRWRPPARCRPAVMGVSDRMANDGLLYKGWGAEGMRTLNSTASLQERAEDLNISRYDAVLIVAARAKANAYQEEEESPGYIGSVFGGPMGAGARKPKPAKSQVISAIEELLDEVKTTGELPELITPGTPEGWTEEGEAGEATGALTGVAQPGSPAEAAAAEEAAAADAAADDAYAAGEELLGAVDDLSLANNDAAADDGGGDVDDLLANLLGDDDGFDDSLSLDDLFGTAGEGGGDSVEAGGMSPGDRG